MKPESMPKISNRELADLLVMQWTAGTLAEHSAMSDRASDQIAELLDQKDASIKEALQEKEDEIERLKDNTLLGQWYRLQEKEVSKLNALLSECEEALKKIRRAMGSTPDAYVAKVNQLADKALDTLSKRGSA